MDDSTEKPLFRHAESVISGAFQDENLMRAQEVFPPVRRKQINGVLAGFEKGLPAATNQLLGAWEGSLPATVDDDDIVTGVVTEGLHLDRLVRKRERDLNGGSPLKCRLHCLELAGDACDGLELVQEVEERLSSGFLGV